MVAHKASQVQAFIGAPSASARAVLLYGPDAGLVSDRAAMLARRFSGGAEVLRLDDQDLAEDPGRLFVELRMASLFGAPNVVRITAGPRLTPANLKPLLSEPLAGALIVEAGNLRPDSGLRKMFEKHKSAAALPCYLEARDLSALIEEEIGKSGLGLEPDAKELLLGLLGSDYAVARSELAKLALFAHGERNIAADIVAEIVGDSSELGLDGLAFHTSGGDILRALGELDRLSQAGFSADAALVAIARHFTQLHRAQSAAELGASLESAVAGLRPPLHFKRRDAFLAHCRRWGAARLAEALTRIHAAASAVRREPVLGPARLEALILGLRPEARRAGWDSSHPHD